MDLKIILLVAVLAISATAHQEMKKRASILDSVPAVLKHSGTGRMAATAKMKGKKTGFLKNACGTCMEMFDDLQSLILSDDMSDNIDWLTNLVCVTKYP